jgi:hypothetical protein
VLSCEDGDYSYGFKRDLSCITAVSSNDVEVVYPSSIANTAAQKSTRKEMCDYICGKVEERYQQINLTPYHSILSGVEIEA